MVFCPFHWTPKQHNKTAELNADQYTIAHFHRLVVLLQLEKDCPENSRVVFCPNKQHSFEPFMCLDLVTS